MLTKMVIKLVFLIGGVCHMVAGFQGYSTRNRTFCKYEEPVMLNCSEGRVISVQTTESKIHHCNQYCDTKFLENVKRLCNGHTICNVTSNIFPNECNRFARYLKINFECSGFWGTEQKSFETCSNTLYAIHCHGYGWGGRHIHFKGVKVLSQTDCGNNTADTSCIWNTLHHQCDDRRVCIDVVAPSCVLDTPIMHIIYLCPEKSTSNTSIEAVTSVLPRDFTTSPMEVFTDSTDERNAVIVLNGSLLLVHDAELQNLTSVFCADDWNDKAASVVCKFLNLPRPGRAINLTNPDNYRVINMSLNCTGDEGSLQECGFIETPCLSTMAAGVVCCDAEQNCPSQKSTGNTETSNTGLAVGLALVVVTALVGTFVVIYLRHRGRLKFMCFNKLKKPNRYTSDNDYIGQQGISLPESSRGNARHEINNDNNENETLYENQPKQRIDSTENAQFYSLASSPEDQMHYATAKEGEYDETNSRRHVANDGNLYDHSVDTVYDSTGNQGSNPTSDSTYSRTVDNVYDGTARKRTNDRGTDGVSLGTYNHTSETAYDVRFFNKSQ